MAACGMLREFDSTKDSIEDFLDRFEFYCLANNLKDEGEALRQKRPYSSCFQALPPLLN